MIDLCLEKFFIIHSVRLINAPCNYNNFYFQFTPVWSCSYFYINVKIPKNFVWATQNKTKIYFNLKDLTIINDF